MKMTSGPRSFPGTSYARLGGQISFLRRDKARRRFSRDAGFHQGDNFGLLVACGPSSPCWPAQKARGAKVSLGSSYLARVFICSWVARHSSGNASAIDVDGPILPVFVAHDFGIFRRTHPPTPNNRRSIDVRGVIDPFVMKDVAWPIANENNVPPARAHQLLGEIRARVKSKISRISSNRC